MIDAKEARQLTEEIRAVENNKEVPYDIWRGVNNVIRNYAGSGCSTVKVPIPKKYAVTVADKLSSDFGFEVYVTGDRSPNNKHLIIDW